MRRRWLGSSVLSWAMAAACVVLMLSVLILSDVPATRFAAGLLLATQVGGLVLTAVRSRRAAARRPAGDEEPASH